jgi:hypothetical protein
MSPRVVDIAAVDQLIRAPTRFDPDLIWVGDAGELDTLGDERLTDETRPRHDALGKLPGVRRVIRT